MNKKMTPSLLSCISVASLATTAVQSGYVPNAADSAVAVIAYDEGAGVGSDFISGDRFDDPSSALGRPTIDTTGDGFFSGVPADQAMTAVPVYPPFRAFELVSIGSGGSLVVELGRPVTDHPRNPFGIDFIVFGNAFHVIGSGQSWRNGDPALTVVAGGVFAEPGRVSVSPGFRGLPGEDAGDHTTWAWLSFDPALAAADTFAATLGREVLSEGPPYWGEPTDPTLPLDPEVTAASVGGLTVRALAEVYASSAGGTGFDLAWLPAPGFERIQFVMIESETGGSPEVDAVTVVRPQCEPADADLDGNYDGADVLLVIERVASGAALGEYGGDPMVRDATDVFAFLSLEGVHCP